MLEEGTFLVSPGWSTYGRTYSAVASRVGPHLDVPRIARVVALEDGQRLDDWGLAATALHTPGHSEGCLSLVTDDGSAFVGDLVQGRRIPRVTPVERPNMAIDASTALASWQKLLDAGVTTIYPGHGAVVSRTEFEAKLHRAEARTSGARHRSQRSRRPRCLGRSKREVNRMDVRIPVGPAELPGSLEVPEEARGIIVFAHGSGSSRLSPRNTSVASYLRRSGSFGTLLFDLLTPAEDRDYSTRFDIELLSQRLERVTRWLLSQPQAEERAVGFFGASTGAAAALRAAAALGDSVAAVVSRGGRPDLAGDALARVMVPTLLIVGGEDGAVIEMNRSALAMIPSAHKEIQLVPGATHLFEEPGTLEQVAALHARVVRAVALVAGPRMLGAIHSQPAWVWRSSPVDA